MPERSLCRLWCKVSTEAWALTPDTCTNLDYPCPGIPGQTCQDCLYIQEKFCVSCTACWGRLELGNQQGQHGDRLLVQVAAERHSVALRSVCIDIATHCLPDVLVSFNGLLCTSWLCVQARRQVLAS